jgi:uncharacterized protein YdeI (YjbR/CyaY-like superfamily)
MTTQPGEPLPEELAAALAADAEATAAWQAMPPSHWREHIKFVGEAKRPETRVKRAAKVVTMTLQWHAARAAPRRTRGAPGQ